MMKTMLNKKLLSPLLAAALVAAVFIPSDGNAKHKKKKAKVGDPVPGLTEEERALFDEGKALFEKDFTPEEGLGPLYNHTSCVACHGHPATGGSQASTENNAVHFGVKSEDRWLEMFEVGGPVEQVITIAGSPSAPDCTMPADDAAATVAALGPDASTSSRHTGAVFGFGLIDAIPDAQILANQNANGSKMYGAMGFTNFGVELETVGPYVLPTPDLTRTQPYGASRVGRFGWKAQTATLWQFSNEPFNVELGVSSPFFARESTPDGSPIPPECDVATHPVNDVDNQQSLRLFYFQAFLAAPPRGKQNFFTWWGEQIFDGIGCADCHTKSYTTAEDYYIPWPDGTAHRVDALSDKTLYPWSDFLVHDMGEDLADERHMGRADGQFWRTTPLWGVRHKTNLLHDGRAESIHEAIMAHGGEGSGARDAYDGLKWWQKWKVLYFLNNL